jgi:hypothetical protein
MKRYEEFAEGIKWYKDGKLTPDDKAIDVWEDNRREIKIDSDTKIQEGDKIYIQTEDGLRSFGVIERVLTNQVFVIDYVRQGHSGIINIYDLSSKGAIIKRDL